MSGLLDVGPLLLDRLRETRPEIPWAGPFDTLDLTAPDAPGICGRVVFGGADPVSQAGRSAKISARWRVELYINAGRMDEAMRAQAVAAIDAVLPALIGWTPTGTLLPWLLTEITEPDTETGTHLRFALVFSAQVIVP